MMSLQFTNRIWELGDQRDHLNDWEVTMFIDPIPRLVVYLFAKYGLKVSIEHITCKFLNGLCIWLLSKIKNNDVDCLQS